jgi:hypothetical protein
VAFLKNLKNYTSIMYMGKLFPESLPMQSKALVAEDLYPLFFAKRKESEGKAFPSMKGFPGPEKPFMEGKAFPSLREKKGV